MPGLSCGHDRAAAATRMCRHLAAAAEGSGLRFVRYFTGVGVEVELLCKPCAKLRQSGQTDVARPVCEPCLTAVVEEDTADLAGTRGAPEVRIRDAEVDVQTRDLPIPSAVGHVLDVAPFHTAWLLLAEDGRLWRLAVDSGEATPVAQSDVPEEPDASEWNGCPPRLRLHVSDTGAFAAVVRDHGRHGQVLGLRSGAPIAALDGGDYLPETVAMSFAFVAHAGRDYAVHRTDWNRLDVLDLATGTNVTDRGPTSFETGEVEPDHYLDYFHGRLHAGPSGRIAADGWVWHPVGLVRAWQFAPWLDNAWESEDGPSIRNVCAAEYHWNRAMVWLDADTLAVSGLGDDDDWILPGARIFDLRRADQRSEAFHVDLALEVEAFAGPSGEFFTDGSALFCADDSGLLRWDWRAGVRTASVPGITPSCRHPQRGEFAELVDGRALRVVSVDG